MKAIKNNLGTQEQLLQARNGSLQEGVAGMLRPHGKLWGMDVFSWYNPALFELENTLSCFPAPVLWIGNEMDIQELVRNNSGWVSNLSLICAHDAVALTLPAESTIETTLGAGALKDALELLRTLKKSNGIFLFTASGDNWKEHQAEFEYFLEIHQTK